MLLSKRDHLASAPAAETIATASLCRAEIESVKVLTSVSSRLADLATR